MDVRKQLAVSIIKFLKTELQNERHDAEGAEAIEVAVQCLENAYSAEGITSELDLLTIYESAVSTAAQPPLSGNNLPSMYPDASQVNKEMAESKKVLGNDLMREGKFNEAIMSYTSAIDFDRNNAIYYSNRAAAYAKLNDNTNSIADCEKALKIDPSYSKAYGRMGLAYFNNENFEKAIEAYEKALSLDPANQPYRVQLDSAREKLNAKNGQATAGGAPAAPNPLAGMDLSALLSNPAVMNMAQNFMTNPQVQNMFANMMGGPGGDPSGGGAPAAGGVPNPQVGGGTQAPPPPAEAPNPMAGFGAGGGFDFNTVLNATSQFASQMQSQNPDVVENLRAQFRQDTPGSENPPQEENKDAK